MSYTTVPKKGANDFFFFFFWYFQVHTACKELLPNKCPLGLCKVSVIPPTALNSIDSDGKYH